MQNEQHPSNRIAAETGLPARALANGAFRQKPVCQARWKAWLDAYNQGYSVSEIARDWGMDRSSVSKALKIMKASE